MTTRLTRPVTRRIGELIVTLEPDGLRLREPRRRKSTLIPWSNFRRGGAAAYAKAAFNEKAPAGWIPSVGDEVFCRPRRGTMTNVVPRGQVVALLRALPLAAVVRLRYGKRHFDITLHLDDLRPAESIWVVGGQGEFA